MKRRDVLQLLAGAIIAAPCGVAAQTTPKNYRLAMLTAGPAFPAESPIVKILSGISGWRDGVFIRWRVAAERRAG